MEHVRAAERIRRDELRSLSGNALAALVSAKAAAAVVASEAIDRRVVMIGLFATDVPKVATSPPPIGVRE
jgi:hypothetical protein